VVQSFARALSCERRRSRRVRLQSRCAKIFQDKDRISSAMNSPSTLPAPFSLDSSAVHYALSQTKAGRAD